MKIYITKMEVHDECNDVVCELELFCDSWSVEWKQNIPSPDTLRYVADIIDNDAYINEIHFTNKVKDE